MIKIIPVQVAVTEYNPTTAALADLQHRYGKAVFNVTTTNGMKDAKAARAELKSLRTSLEAKRKEIKAPVLAQAELIDSEAKRITALIEALEKPIDAQIKAEEKRREEEKAARERAERERVKAILGKINELRIVPMMMTGKPAVEIKEAIDYLGAMQLDTSLYMEFTGEAQQAVSEAIAKLLDMHKRQEAHEQEQERISQELHELLRLRKEREAEEARLTQEREALAAEQRRLEEVKAHADLQSATGNLVTSHRGKRFDLKTQEHIAKFKMRAQALLETHTPDELRAMLEEVIALGVPA